jgi:hypothetical protein
MRSSFFGLALMLVLLAGCAREVVVVKADHSRYPYTKPLTSPGGKFGALPPGVQNTVRAEAGMAEIVDAIRDTSSGRVVYVVYFRDAANFPPLYVAPDGSVLYPDLTVAVPALLGTVVKPASVPAPVMKVIQERAPSAEVASIYREKWGSRVVYIFSFKDQTHFPKLDIAADGTVLEEVPE